jgi:hypothetical protein
MLHPTNADKKALESDRQLAPLLTLSSLKTLDLSRNGFYRIPALFVTPAGPQHPPTHSAATRPANTSSPPLPEPLELHPSTASLGAEDIAPSPATITTTSILSPALPPPPSPLPSLSSLLFSPSLASSLTSLNLSHNRINGSLPRLDVLVSLEILK